MDSFPLSRRQVLLGAAGTVLLAACGTSDNGDEAATTSTTSDGQGGLLALLVPPEQAVGVPLRLPLGLADDDGSFDVDLPSAATFRLIGPNGKAAGSPLTVELHDRGLPRGYFPLRTTFEQTGRWTIVLEAGKRRLETTLDVREKSELAAVPGPGDFLPKIPTPTTANHQGVDPICTRDPVCPFHELSLDQTIGGKQPIALLVSTPAFCQVAICGPVLDLLVKRRSALEERGIAVIHAEVYTDETAKTTTPTVDALGLQYEPALFLAAPDGTVNDRFDAIFDQVELDEAIAHLIP